MRTDYRCYVNRRPSDGDRTIYIMIVDKADRIAALHRKLSECFGEQLNMITYPSDDYKGFAYIKIYNKNASKRKMLEHICDEYGLERSVALKGGEDSINSIARELKKGYEPLLTILPKNPK